MENQLPTDNGAAIPEVSSSAAGSHPGDVLWEARLSELRDVQRHRREMERLTAEHVAEQMRLNNAHIEHVKAIEARHEETVSLLKAIIAEIQAARMQQAPTIVPYGPPPPHCPPNYPWYPWWQNPVTCDRTSTGMKTECGT